MQGSTSDKEGLLHKTAEFPAKFIVSPQKGNQTQDGVNPPSLLLREREREEQLVKIERRNKSKGANRRTAASTTVASCCVQSHQLSSGLTEVATSGTEFPDEKEALALASIASAGISQSNKTEGGRRNDRLLQNHPNKMQSMNSGAIVNLIR